MEKQTLLSPSGASLALFVTPATSRVRGAVQINHGFAEHAARYGRFAAALAKAGFHVYAHDHRGHGETKAPDARQGMFAPREGALRVLDDVAAVHMRIAQDFPDLPIITFGHSMGGLIALNHAVRHPEATQALAIWNSNFGVPALNATARFLLGYERFRLGHDVPSRLLPRMTFRQWAAGIPGRKGQSDWLSRDEAEVNGYERDPLCGFDGSVAMWTDVFALMKVAHQPERMKRLRSNIPVNLVGGTADPATEGGKSVLWLDKRLRAQNMSDVTVTIYPDTRHETLNEINRDDATAEFISWLKQRFPPL
ncbi:alpha/beta fold hydrolase [Limoniibacter endophyticus]|uniref:Lysophospholipase n=1 Tax=Limoniibacter endophyticus TaxID=1565040 RepID=A0A8J3DIK2_9HYPH|nr:alpha/beta hydrolase [Limoniibacter endophyticus]GHC75062.1 lysophospholipase [Limoniibacter endophyticus]